VAVGATAVKTGATYEDLLGVPDHLVAEIIDGELHTSPRPSVPHANAATSLGALLWTPFQGGQGGPGGWWILDEPELHLHDSTAVPDLAGWRRSRLLRLSEGSAIDVAPDWVCEVLSPSTERLDRAKKLALYRREQVGNVWLVNPLTKALEVLRLQGDLYALLAVHSGDDRVRAEPFEAIELDLSLLWMTGATAGDNPGGATQD
jgi:Uma2 family endonuclease